MWSHRARWSLPPLLDACREEQGFRRRPTGGAHRSFRVEFSVQDDGKGPPALPLPHAREIPQCVHIGGVAGVTLSERAIVCKIGSCFCFIVVNNLTRDKALRRRFGQQCPWVLTMRSLLVRVFQELELFCEAAGVAGPQARLLSDRETGKPRGLAIVQLGSTEEVEKAVLLLEGKALGGRELRIKRDGA